MWKIFKFHSIPVLLKCSWVKLNRNNIRPACEKYRHKRLQKKYVKILSGIKNRDFSIISSNCWGSSVYEDLRIPYKTPTVGLFFYAPCFLEFIENLPYNLNGELSFIDISKYDQANKFRITNYFYPIGLINKTIEVHFLHYKDCEDALVKWNRRKKRVNYDNLFFSFTDQDEISDELIRKFDSLSYRKKVLFTSKKHPNINCAVQLKIFSLYSSIRDIYNSREIVTNYFRLDKWLNKH